MRVPPLGVGGRLVDRGPHQRMTERELPGLDPDQIGPLRRVERLGRNTQLHRRCQHCRQAGRFVGGSHQQQALGLLGESADPLHEDALDRIGHRQRPRQRFPTRELARSDQRGQLDQRERVAARCLHQTAQHLGRNWDTDALGQQLSTRLRIQPVDAAVRVARVRRTGAHHRRGRRRAERSGPRRPGGPQTQERWPTRRRATGRRRSRIAPAISVASSSSIPRTATDTRKRLSWPFATRPNATDSASACGAGSRST